MTIDSHIHSTFSIDAKSSMEDMCEAALKRNLAAVCFTEHCDMNPIDWGSGFFDYDRYSDAIKRNQDKYAGRLLVLKGIEFSEPHLFPGELERLAAKDFDFILGSVHMVGPHWVGDPDYVASTPIERIFEAHYEETVKACKAGLFDSLAHIDFPKRYLEEKSEPLAILAEALDALVAAGISLEINTSPLRKGYAEACPSDAILDLYLERGGSFVTTGSDAHFADDIAADFDGMPKRESMRLCYYRDRKRIVFD